mmetsp:Transcript_6157/g.15228  ORF Transcript_6157/g.15228 Transcript_6157/m.15228 type:complete len:146 (-) Transcript_6157:170-607(-)
MIGVGTASIGPVVPVLAVPALVVRTTMDFSDLAKMTSHAKVVRRAILEKSQVPGEAAVAERAAAVIIKMNTMVLPVDRALENVVAAEDEQMISDDFFVTRARYKAVVLFMTLFRAYSSFFLFLLQKYHSNKYTVGGECIIWIFVI